MQYAYYVQLINTKCILFKKKIKQLLLALKDRYRRVAELGSCWVRTVSV